MLDPPRFHTQDTHPLVYGSPAPGGSEARGQELAAAFTPGLPGGWAVGLGSEAPSLGGTLQLLGGTAWLLAWVDRVGAWCFQTRLPWKSWIWFGPDLPPH